LSLTVKPLPDSCENVSRLTLLLKISPYVILFSIPDGWAEGEPKTFAPIPPPGYSKHRIKYQKQY